MTLSLKILSILIFIATTSITVQSQDHKKSGGIEWLSLESALKKSSQDPKKIFIDVYTGWCGWCKRMDATTFEDPAVIAYMNKNFYPVKLDAETKDTIFYKDKTYLFKPEYKANEIAAIFMNGQMSYPTSVYLDEKSDPIGPVAGYMTEKQLLPVMKYFAEDIYKTKKWEDYLQENFK
ncbi:MAG: DUF255 domain-containing protein [Bacteroidetes bacterium]|jgi:thioredoxin-related protein|nr:DUF255 domain-containing protein [Bacteroidota bacterium]MBK9543003.1 DUF255 domain-containing protein [Bacteroidota bacterium]MBP6400936.1 DUF255 domain-containing protein [Bacteroidia bacterium]MBP6649667.1 DUF255 domain-containing protein [Bacteroidia bacterium]